MIIPLDSYLLGVFLALCRIGGCLMLMPGFSSARVPARVRLYAAVALAAIVTPIVAEPGMLDRRDAGHLLGLVSGEIVVGGTIGLVARLYIAAIEFMGSAIASLIGLNGLGTGIESEEPSPALSTLVTLAATLSLLILDLHRLLITTVIDSYSTLPIGAVPDPRSGLRLLTDTLDSAFMLALQMGGPFVVYGVVVNLMFGILGKLIPQVPSFFVSVPFMAFGGLLLLYFSLGEMLPLLARAIGAALGRL